MAKTGRTLIANDIAAHFKASAAIVVPLNDNNTMTAVVIKNGFNICDISRAVLSLMVYQMIY